MNVLASRIIWISQATSSSLYQILLF